jgi:hypothetical protein
MHFSRHAKNEARRLRVSVTDAEDVIAAAVRIDFDEKGRPRYTGYAKGVRVRVVVALDEPELIVTIHERRN